MDNTKNTLLAVVLMLVVWIGFSFLFPPQQGPEQPVVPAEIREPRVETTPEAPAPAVPAADIPTAAADERRIVVENDLFRAVLSTSGARLVELELKDYFTTAAQDERVVLVAPGSLQSATIRTAGTEGLDLSPDFIYHLDAEQDSITLGPGENRRLVFTAPLAGGLVVEKVFTFEAGSYNIGLTHRLRNASTGPLGGALQVTLVEPWDESKESGYFEFVGPVALVGDDFQQLKVDKILDRPAVFGTNVVWTGFLEKYFLRAAVLGQGTASRVQIEKRDNLILNHIVTPYASLSPGQAVDYEMIAYFGPKELDILRASGYDLERAIDFGFFSVLARPLLHVLKFFYSFLGNYGLAIILLTVIIKLLFWPLTHKSFASMKAMQKLQPEMAKIREKYKKDPKKLNQEIMELYKKHRVNPLGGCLPMLVQIPVFFALYKVLMDGIELRHAPFYFWITDLSAKDPYYITPLIMGATMFIQQKMTPSTMDPMQARIFMLMPVIFTFMFLNFPSGLVLYWLINNVLTILQQYLIHRRKV